MNLCLTNFEGGGSLAGQRSVKEFEKKSFQMPITCEWKQVGPSNLSSIIMRLDEGKKIFTVNICM